MSIEAFDFKEELERVTINLTHAHIWDQAAVAAIDKVGVPSQRCRGGVGWTKRGEYHIA